MYRWFYPRNFKIDKQRGCHFNRLGQSKTVPPEGVYILRQEPLPDWNKVRLSQIAAPGLEELREERILLAFVFVDVVRRDITVSVRTSPTTRWLTRPG